MRGSRCGMPAARDASEELARHSSRFSGAILHIARTAMQRNGGDVRLVDRADPRRLAWAVTEFSIQLGDG